MTEYVRLQKFLADNGVCSRRAAEKLIEEGRVTVSGKPAFIGQKVKTNATGVRVDGSEVRLNTGERAYYMLYKPRGYITTAKDESDRKTVCDLLRKEKVRLYPVGRLDRDSEGLVIMTNDGALAEKLTHPKNRVPKTYRAIVRGEVDAAALSTLSNGVYLPDLDVTTSPADVELHEKKEDRTVLLITIYEGKNRQIRRMCDAVGLEVLRLKRERIGTLSIGRLTAGQYRKLTEKEVKYLRSL